MQDGKEGGMTELQGMVQEGKLSAEMYRQLEALQKSEIGDLTAMAKTFKDATGAGEEVAAFFCTDALERGLTWQHAVDSYEQNQQRKTDASMHFSSLQKAAEFGHAAACVRFLSMQENGPSCEELDIALCGAVMHEQVDVALLLLTADADSNCVMDDKANTVLHVAAAKGMLQVVGALLAAGARPQNHNALGQTPLDEAIDGSHLDVCFLLIQHGQLYMRFKEFQRFQPIKGWSHLCLKSTCGSTQDVTPQDVAPLQTPGHRWMVDWLTESVDIQGFRCAHSVGSQCSQCIYSQCTQCIQQSVYCVLHEVYCVL
jgi:hypothetical protein